MKKEKQTYRLFIAAFAQVDDYKGLKQKLGSSFHGRWVRPENLHMTFKFLGDIDDPKTVIEKLKKLNYKKKQIVKFQRLKLFNKRILSLRSSNKTLYKIHDQLEDLLGNEFKREETFKPHISLMRVKKIKNKEYKEFFKTFEVHGTVELKIVLVQSRLDPEGVRYKILREF
ncbi:MAG: RNA 2',3'-cyclic phosphodiesterase [Campylobacterota bacterium]|nr:RNA 2',3'-cyclic phosphodiesterase [Campylobacterota bacterium]